MTGSTPDWAGMAEANEREGRRKRLLRVGLGLAGALALGGIVVAAVVVQGSGGTTPSADHLPAMSASASSPASGSASSPAGAQSVTPSATASGAGDGLSLGPAAQVGSVDGHNGPALTVLGHSDGYAEADSTGVDTATSFTVSAMVRNDASAQPKAAVSEGGDAFFSLYLGREDYSTATRDRWVFKVQTAAAAGNSVMALSTTPAAIGRWTTLTGVYDAKARTISLYVDGALAQTTPVPHILPANGPIEIGRARYKSHWADAWNGSIADVQVWAQSLAPTQVAQLARTRSADIPAQATWLRF
ncbi:LamG domain-containing protein [Streptacidiphilus sp. EB129]|uniref:LamG domain-containing protein n=1 Tax=Streptacidiphilus sp. EB129 TaxID=3156262 RepID=UPI003515CA0C